MREPTPLANLHLTLLDKVGVRLDTFADSQGKVKELLRAAVAVMTRRSDFAQWRCFAAVRGIVPARRSAPSRTARHRCTGPRTATIWKRRNGWSAPAPT